MAYAITNYMGKIVQLKRGSKEHNDNYTGAPGEVTVVEDDWSLYIHDGKTPGGHPVGQNVLDYAVRQYITNPFIKDAYQRYEAAKAELAMRIKLLKDSEEYHWEDNN